MSGSLCVCVAVIVDLLVFIDLACKTPFSPIELEASMEKQPITGTIRDQWKPPECILERLPVSSNQSLHTQLMRQPSEMGARRGDPHITWRVLSRPWITSDSSGKYAKIEKIHL